MFDRYVRRITDKSLRELADEAWQHHKEFAGQPWLISPSAPVLFFGDYTAYQKSPLRIATVGLNPSWREFPVGSSFSRFSGADSAHIPRYLTSLERYFRTNPYKQWFNSYENVLCGLDASYYREKPNTVLHTDIGSVLPTKPTWRDLGHNDQKSIADVGVPLWHRLIAYLQPQIILWSTAKIWLDRLELEPHQAHSPWRVIREFRETNGALRKRTIAVCARWHQLPNGRPVLIAYIPAALTPAAFLSDPQKQEAGSAILNSWRFSYWRLSTKL